MTNTMIPATFAAHAIDNYFAPMTADDLADYFPTRTRAAMIDAIADDFADALHNSNLDFFFTDAFLDAMTDSDFESLNDHLLTIIDDTAPIIADHFLAC